MSSEEISLQSGLNVFQDDPLRAAFSCGPTRPGPKTRELSSFIDEKMFPFPSSQGADEYRGGNLYGGSERRDPPAEPRNWRSGSGSHSGEESDEDEDDDDDEGEEEDDGDGDENNIEVVVDVNGHSGNDKSNTGSVGVHCSAGNLNSDKVANGNGKLHPSFGGASREVVMKESVTMVQTSGDSSYQNEVTVAQRNGDMYYVQYLHGVDGSGCVGAGQKEVIAENASSCGISGRKESSFSSESSDSLRAILSDPITGALMDDAMILPCGHSFTSAGLEHVLRMKACYTCSLSVSEDSVAPNLSLRTAVQAFRREEEMQIYRSSKRRRERYEQDKAGQSDPNLMDYSRGRGVQFPFAVMDRVIIKGNKRTPQRFVGREAVVTTQCLNGWYVVKTLDNAESVKLQYRSLAKLPDNPSSKVMSGKMGPNWQ